MRTTVRRSVVAARLVVGAGLVAQLWLRWISRGNGSTFTGARLGSALLHARWVGEWGRGVGAFIFVLALLGAASVAAAPARSVVTDWVYLGMAVLLLALGSFVIGLGAPAPDRWGPGLFVVAGAGLLALLAGIVGVVGHGSTSSSIVSFDRGSSS